MGASWADRNQKNHPFEVLSSLILLNNEPFPNRIVTHDKSGFSMTRLNQLKRVDWEDALDQSQTRTERAWSLSGGLLQVWSTTAFRILAKSLHLRSLLRKLMRYTVNFNVCSWQWSTESAQFFSASYWTLHNHCFKSWTNWAKKFCPICHIHLTTWIPLLQASWQLFAGKTLPTTSRM